jgi:hypothetical protein
MHMLRQWQERLYKLSDFIDEAMSTKVCQGVVLDLNPIWLAGWRAYAAGLNPRSAAGFAPLHLQLQLGLRQDGDPFIDIEWRDDEVTRRISEVFPQKINREHEPFLVKAIALVDVPPETTARRTLTNVVRQAPWAALVEARPPAMLSVASGDGCTSLGGRNGTIGGFLLDRKTQNIYAATCGHVVPAPGASVISGGVTIGTCTHTKAPTPLAAGQVCRPGASVVSALDLALIDLGATQVTNTVKGMAPVVYPTEIVRMTGAISLTSSYAVGGVCVTYIAGGVCFDKLFEVRPPTIVGVLAPWVRALSATVPQLGDSGAWLQRSSSQEWCGILTATDTQQGYAQEASDAVSEANRQFGTDLVPV